MKKKKFVIAQKPNLPIIVWFVSFVLLQISYFNFISTFLELVSFGAIFTWAWLEIFQGANWFRRALGTVVMIVILAIRMF